MNVQTSVGPMTCGAGVVVAVGAVVTPGVLVEVGWPELAESAGELGADDVGLGLSVLEDPPQAAMKTDAMTPAMPTRTLDVKRSLVGIRFVGTPASYNAGRIWRQPQSLYCDQSSR